MKARVYWTGTGIGPSLFGGGPVHLKGLLVVLGASAGRFAISRMGRPLMLSACASECYKVVVEGTFALLRRGGDSIFHPLRLPYIGVKDWLLGF